MTAVLSVLFSFSPVVASDNLGDFLVPEVLEKLKLAFETDVTLGSNAADLTGVLEFLLLTKLKFALDVDSTEGTKGLLLAGEANLGRAFSACNLLTLDIL